MSSLSCSVRPLGRNDLQRFSYTTPLTSNSSSSPSLHWNGKVRKRISRSSSYSSSLWGSQLPSFNGSYEPCFSIVRIWISPLCMGRRSSKIATRKVIYFAILFSTFSITHFKFYACYTHFCMCAEINGLPFFCIVCFTIRC
ncbi:unnamed protein product [Amaranthus hypochondriacus]